MEILLIGYIILINVITWSAFGLDKWKAKRNAWRIPERILILLAFLGGSLGALTAMGMFRHKTRKPKFFVGIPVILVLHIALAALLVMNL